MKTLYLIAKNHMDPSWLRCFTDHARDPATGDVVRPYSDLEEIQILEYMDFAEKYGVVYQIEQSAVVKKFLERNPDQRERFAALVKKGLIELAGGGETVIDYNLTSGESWARNHLYSRKYYEEEFSHAPRYAITPDIFGLPAQLPQFFRSLGYDADILFDRVFKNGKPFWKGLDGTVIVIDDRWLDPPEPYLRTADCVKLRVCPVCRGEGCSACCGAGVDTSYNMTRPDKEPRPGAYYGNRSADDIIDELSKSDKDEFFILITTEEPPIGDRLFGRLRDAGKEKGIDVRYVGFEENHDIWCRGYVERLRRGDYTEDEIDPRREGNPASSGDCSSRIEIKKANRELEQLLTEAETLATCALLRGGWRADALPRRDYPEKKLEALWNKMAFIQFHDCITGTHTDASYTELERYIREVRRGGEQIYRDAALELLRGSGVKAPDGFRAAAYFNPTPYTVAYPTLRLRAPVGEKNAEIFDGDLSPLPSLPAEAVDGMADAFLTVAVKADVKPFSARVFYYRPAPVQTVNARIAPDCVIENRFYRVKAENGMLGEVFDKTAGRAAVKRGGLTLTADGGSPWGRAEPEKDSVALKAACVRVERGDHFESLVFEGVYTEKSRRVERLAWQMRVTLREDEPLVRFDTLLDWQGEQTKIYASFTPAFDHCGDIFTEVPFGTMKRGSAEGVEMLGYCDDWQSMGFAGVEGDGMSVAVLKGGLPGANVRNGDLRIALLRAMRTQMPDFDSLYRGTADRGAHRAAFALACAPAGFADGRYSERSAAYVVLGHTELPTCDGPGIADASLLPFFPVLPPGLRLSAVKRAEDGSGIVIRLWESEGKPAVFKPDGGAKLLRCDTLERPTAGAAVSEYAFRPFEIATFRVVFSDI